MKTNSRLIRSNLHPFSTALAAAFLLLPGAFASFAQSTNGCIDILCTNLLASACSNCVAVPLSTLVIDNCCSNSPMDVSYGIGGNPIDTNYCFPLGVSTVQVLAMDSCGNSNTCSFTVTVLQATNPPVIVFCPTNIFICTNSGGCGIMPDKTGEVQAGAGAIITQSIPSGTLVCSNTSVTFTVSDPCGNVTQTNVPCTLVDCASSCLQIQCWTNVVVLSCTNVPVYYNPTATDVCCGSWTVSCTPASGSEFSPGTTNTVTCVATDICGSSNSCSFTVTVLPCPDLVGACCGPGLGPQTINWLPFPTNGAVLSDPSGTNPQGSWYMTNLPCYGRVLVTQNFPDRVLWFLNTNLANVPNGNGAFNFTAPGYGPYSWGTGAWMDFLATNQDNYTITFYFLDGPPNPCNLFLNVAGLAVGTTANASQPLVFRTEYDLNAPLSDNTYSAETTLNGVYGPPIGGSGGTLVGSAANQTGGDSVNTGWAMFQPIYALQTTNLAAGSVQGLGGLPLNNLPYLSLSVAQQGGDGIGFTMGYVCCNTNCLQVESPGNILIDSCTNVLVAYPQLVVTDPCCGTNWSVVYDPPAGTSFAPGAHTLVNWFLYDCSSGTNFAAAGSFFVSVVCTNCCQGPFTNYTVTVVQGSNYLADCLCQGTSNTLADVLPSVPAGTEVYFWNPTTGNFNPPDTFTGGTWHPGTEPMVTGEGFLLVSFTSQYSLTIYGIQPECSVACSTLDCFSPTVLAGDYGLDPNPVPFCDLFCCPPAFGTGVQVWDATSQSFTTYTYKGFWSPAEPPALPVGYSEFVSVDRTACLGSNAVIQVVQSVTNQVPSVSISWATNGLPANFWQPQISTDLVHWITLSATNLVTPPLIISETGSFYLGAPYQFYRLAATNTFPAH